jgi:hypothetical protein
LLRFVQVTIIPPDPEYPEFCTSGDRYCAGTEEVGYGNGSADQQTAPKSL